MSCLLYRGIAKKGRRGGNVFPLLYIDLKMKDYNGNNNITLPKAAAKLQCYECAD